MDACVPQPRRQKRSFPEISHTAIASPSPIHLREVAPPNHSISQHFAPRLSSTPSKERRRTPHPHNNSLQLFHRGSIEMPEQSRAQLRPRLEHRTSQTIIDLTDEAEDRAPASRNNGGRRPPQLGRSDLQNIMDVIDLTEDTGEPEIEITHSRAREPRERPLRQRPGSQIVPQGNRTPHAQHEGSPSLFVSPSPPQRQIPQVGYFQAGFEAMLGLALPGRLVEAMPQFHQHLHQHIMHAQQQPMPDGLNDENHAFGLAAPRHVAPSPARDNFTRSPKEDDIVICPNCEEELMKRKDVQEVATSKSGRASSRKDREEHPFWVVKGCGHVYCNRCYQNRSKSGAHQQFRDMAKSSKRALKCAVDDCESDVKSKEKWVGVFL